jgi:lysophospholipase L1-like esterase
MAVLDTWNTALAARATTAATVVWIGDSVSEGQDASTKANRWQDIAIGTIRTAYPTTGPTTTGSNYLPAAYAVASPDSTWGTPATTTGTVGFDGFAADPGYRQYDLSIGATLTYTVTGDHMDFWYYAGGSSGTLSYKIDGGTAVPIATAGASVVTRVANISPGSSGSHTIVITCSVATSYFCGLTLYNGDSTIGTRSIDFAHSGYKASDFLQDTTGLTGTLNTLSPDLVTIELGLNEIVGNVPAATFNTNLQTLVTLVLGLTKVPSLLLIATWSPDTSLITPRRWADYIAVMNNVVAANPTKIAMLDLSQVMPQATLAGTGNYHTDGVHPNNTGHTLMAGYVTNALGIGSPPAAAPVLASVGAIGAESGSTIAPGAPADVVSGSLILVHGWAY